MIILKNTRIGARHGNVSGGFCIAAIQPPYPGSLIMGKAWNRINYQLEQKIGTCIFVKEIQPYISSKGKRIRKAKFRCGCGKEFDTAISNVRGGHTKSCGCKTIQFIIEANLIHGLSNHRLHDIWTSIIQRCYNENNKRYKDYGGRGIMMHEPWRNDFKAFYDYVIILENAMHPGLSIDRIKNDEGYDPENLRWATIKQQNNNKRKKYEKKIS